MLFAYFATTSLACGSIVFHSAHLIYIDSECIGRQVNNYTLMLEWLEDELAASTALWKIVIGHRPIYRCVVSYATADAYMPVTPFP